MRVISEDLKTDVNVCSDGVLNPAGVRFGSAEIYAVTDTMPQIADAICVGQRCPGSSDEKVLLFVKLPKEGKLTSVLVDEIKKNIRSKYSPRHVPARIIQVPDIPYTASGKKCEVVVKKLVNGESGIHTSSVANVACLSHFQDHCVDHAQVNRGTTARL